MEIKRLQSWIDFENEIDKLRRSYKVMKDEKYKNLPDMLFRGQSNSKWNLETTMERFIGKKFGVSRYHKLINNIKPRVEAFTGKRWTIPEYPEFSNYVESIDSTNIILEPELYEYMAYLRHHGFPSPLLDWSKSPYVAAYFAFRELLSCSAEIAIFAYIGHLGGKAGWAAGPFIKQLGSYINPDKRHFLQHCDYTICTGLDVDKNKIFYSCHEDVFSESNKRQDILYKFILPASERKEALKKLDMQGINAYTLFLSEESLMESVFLHENYLYDY